MGFFDWILRGVGFESEDGSRGSRKSKKTQEYQEEVPPVYEPAPVQETDYAPTEELDPNTFSANPDQFNTNTFIYDSYEKLAQANVGGYGTKNVVIYYPKNYQEVQTLIDYLKQGESAIMNLDGISDVEAQRILDFVSGAVYALNGSTHRITGNIFILTPEGLNIMVPKQ